MYTPGSSAAASAVSCVPALSVIVQVMPDVSLFPSEFCALTPSSGDMTVPAVVLYEVFVRLIFASARDVLPRYDTLRSTG